MKKLSESLLVFGIVVTLVACAGKSEKANQEAKEADTEENVAVGETTDSTPTALEQLVQKVEADYGNYWNHREGWDKALLQRLGEKQEYAELLPLTQLLIDFSLKREEALKTWDEDVKKLEDYDQIFPRDMHKPIDYEWEEKFISLVHDNPALLDYPGILIETITGFGSFTTKDQNLRIYSWDTGRGGEINSVLGQFYQFRTDDGKVCVPMYSKLQGIKATPSLLNDDDWLMSEMPWEDYSVPNDIYVIDTKLGRVYLEDETLEASATMYYEQLTAKTISGNDVVEYPLFNEDGKKSASIRTASGGIKYDEKSHTLIVEKYKERDKFDEKEGWFIHTGTDTYKFDGSFLKIELKIEN